MRAERDGADDRPIGATVLMGMDALAWKVLIYETVVGSAVGTTGEDVVVLYGLRLRRT